MWKRPLQGLAMRFAHTSPVDNVAQLSLFSVPVGTGCFVTSEEGWMFYKTSYGWFKSPNLGTEIGLELTVLPFEQSYENGEGI